MATLPKVVRAASGPTQAGATSTKIERREFGDADLGRKFLDNVPDEFFRHRFAPNFASAAHATEKAGTDDSSSLHPVVQETLHPTRDWHGSNVTSLSPQIHDYPMCFAVLKLANGERGEFVTTEAASKKSGEQCPIALAFDPLAIRRLPERSTLVGA